jgi:hypothetical protein
MSATYKLSVPDRPTGLRPIGQGLIESGYVPRSMLTSYSSPGGCVVCGAPHVTCKGVDPMARARTSKPEDETGTPLTKPDDETGQDDTQVGSPTVSQKVDDDAPATVASQGTNFTASPTVDGVDPASDEPTNRPDPSAGSPDAGTATTRFLGGQKGRPQMAEPSEPVPTGFGDASPAGMGAHSLHLNALQRDAKENPADSSWVNSAGQLILGPDAETSIEADDLGDGNVRVTRDVLRQFYPTNSLRPHYSQVVAKGTVLPKGQLTAIEQGKQFGL